MAKESYRSVKKKNYTNVGNSLLWDKDATLEAKGLMAIFLSNAGGWELHMREIITRSKNGRDKHFNVVNELIELGYFARIERLEKGIFREMIYIFSDSKEDVKEALKEFEEDENMLVNRDRKKKKKPRPENPDTVEGGVSEPRPENPDTVEPDTEKPDTESQDNNNTIFNKTKSNNTNSNKTNQSFSLSLGEMYDEEALPISMLKVLDKNLDRLIEDNIHPVTVKSFYDVFTEHKLSDSDFTYVLEKVLTQTKSKIGNFHAVMKKAADNFYKEYK